jgi:hypothetical protein
MHYTMHSVIELSNYFFSKVFSLAGLTRRYWIQTGFALNKYKQNLDS